jgi:hypothetical protein
MTAPIRHKREEGEGWRVAVGGGAAGPRVSGGHRKGRTPAGCP